MNERKTKPLIAGEFLQWRKRTIRRVFLIALGVVALGVLIYFAYIMLHFQFYTGYRDDLTGHTYAVEEGAMFTALEDDDPQVDGMVLAAENENFKLYTDTATANVAVYDKRNGETVYSNPPDLEDDPIANNTNMNYLKSQFLLDYYNASRTAGTYDSYSMSVAREQVAVEAIEGGIRYRYVVGEIPEITYYVPIALSPEKYDEIMAVLNESDANTISRMYTLGMDAEGIYGLITSARSNVRTLRKIDNVLRSAGFTEADYYEQTALVSAETEEPMTFVIPLEYRLCDSGVEVSMPVSLMEENGGGYIYRVQLLRTFGAAGTDETGYMVVPDGAGALIDFNNGKTTSAAYSQYIYDMDLMDANYTKLENAVTARLPLFGICREDSSVLATIEDGATLCYLTADVAGKYNSYNTIYPSFVLRGYDILSMFGVSGTEADLPILEKNLYDENITVRYTLLTDEYTGYSGLANYYRERLIDEGTLTPETESGDIPFFYDVLGGVKETAHFIGVKYKSVNAMTTFAEAEEMARELADLGVTNQILNFQGWMNGGYYHDVADSVHVLGKLGGKSGLEELNTTVSQRGGTLYADVAFQNVTNISRHYNRSYESSRYYGAGYTAILGQVNPALLRRVASLGYNENLYSLLSPKFLARYVDGFIQSTENLSFDGISLRDLGSEVHSDKHRTDVISREEALEIVTRQLEKLEDTGRKLLISGGNAYALQYADAITGAPLTTNAYFIVDEEIPLYQMVVHGCIDYAGSQINLSDSADWQSELLRMIEYGASCRYVFTWEDAADMKYTALNSDYATTFASWKDSAAAFYTALNEALSPVSAAQMTGHERVGDVARVAYSNGVTIYINYGSEPATLDGLTIDPQDYRLEGVSP